MESRDLLKKIEERERKNKEDAARIQAEKNAVYQGLAVACIKDVFKVRDDLEKPFKSFLAVNVRLAELEALYPGYLGFLQKADSWETGFEAAEVKYLIEYLLTSKWNKDGDFWRVMNQISDSINVPSNPFRFKGGD